jgi:hypothetical protein
VDSRWRIAGKMGRMSKETDSVTTAVRELAKADVLAFGGVGLVGRILPATEAYLAVAARLGDGDKVRPQLAWLLANGSAAGKAYAATLLNELDPAAGREAWRSLVKDKTQFTTFSGCIMGRTTLAEYAAGRAGV